MADFQCCGTMFLLYTHFSTMPDFHFVFWHSALIMITAVSCHCRFSCSCDTVVMSLFLAITGFYVHTWHAVGTWVQFTVCCHGRFRVLSLSSLYLFIPLFSFIKEGLCGLHCQ